MSQALYTQWPARARRSWGFGALGIVVLTFVLSAIPAALIGAAIVAIDIAQGTDPIAAQRGLEQNALGFLLPAILAQFTVWGGLIWLWARLFERRKAPSLGLNLSGLAILRYGIGLVLGLALLVAMGSVGVALGQAGSGDELAVLAGAERLADPLILAVFAFVIVVFLVQGGAEEIIFRGWLMSTLAARWGVRSAVIVSSLCFMVFHAHVFVSGWVFGLVALSGLGMMGLVFALLSLFTRSIVEAIAAHGAFNAAAVSLPTALIFLESPDQTLSAILSDVFASATGTAGAGGGIPLAPELFAQGLTAGAIAAALTLVLMARNRTSQSYQGTEAVEEV